MGTSAEYQIELRGVVHNDLALILAWRSDWEIIRYLPSAPEKPTWEEHETYWRKAYHCDWMIDQVFGSYLLAPRRPVGIVHIIPATGEVGIIIGARSLWGKGIATKALGLMLERARGLKLVRKPIYAEIHPENIASQRVFTKVGFVNTKEPGRNGQERWELR